MRRRDPLLLVILWWTALVSGVLVWLPLRLMIRESWAGYAAATWALIFALLHVVWAMGWHIGLDPELARQAFQQRWFLIYDVVVAALCALAVWVALALVRPWGSRLPRSLVGGLAWSGTAVLILRGGAGAAQTVYSPLFSPGFVARPRRCRQAGQPQRRGREA